MVVLSSEKSLQCQLKPRWEAPRGLPGPQGFNVPGLSSLGGRRHAAVGPGGNTNGRVRLYNPLRAGLQRPAAAEPADQADANAAQQNSTGGGDDG